MSIEFESFGKIPRLNRDIVITEKIDGTNAAIGIELVQEDFSFEDNPKVFPVCPGDGNIYAMYAQSRKRLITSNDDNYGFARWVEANAVSLFDDLGEGLHFGEWWGGKIQRGYGLAGDDKRFSLFNVKRWTDPCPIDHAGDDSCFFPKSFDTKNLGVVPVLYRGPFSTPIINWWIEELARVGSYAVPGYDRPEGIIIYHTAGNLLFKVTVVGDEKPKSLHD